jgi:hypothetical protein
MSVAIATPAIDRAAPRFDIMAKPLFGPITEQKGPRSAVGPNDRIAAFRSLEQIRQSSA